MRPLTILCADDERSVLLTLRDQLQRHFPDCSVEIAEGGAEALELIDELIAAGVEVPLVIADQVMPTMRGDELLIELHRRHAESLKVMLSGQASCGELHNAVNQANLYRCLSKPWSEADLQRTVTEALQCYRQQRQTRLRQQQLEQTNRELAAANAELRQQLQACQQELGQTRPQATAHFPTLQESQERNRTVLSAMPDIMTVISADGHYLDISFNQFSGQTIPLQGGASVSDVLPPAAAQTCLTAIQRAIQTGEIQTHEQQIPFGDRIQYEEVRIVPFQADRVLCMVRDVTERKQTELRLQQTTAELDRFFSVSLDLFCIASLDGYFLRLNPAWERTLGYSLEELKGRQILDFVHPEDLASTLKSLATWADQQEVSAFVNRYRHRDGSYCWIEWRSIPVGELVYAAARDITARKQTETQLQESERRLAMALSAAKAGVWEWDITTNRTYWSTENARLMGYQPGTVETTYDTWLRAVHPDDQGWVHDAVLGVIAESQDLNLEYRVLLPDGTVRWLGSIGQLIKNDQGQPIAMSGLKIDITERKQIEREILQSRDLREAIFNESADALFLVDPNTLLTLDCNKRAVEMFEADSKQPLINIEGHILQARRFTVTELEQITAELAEKGCWSLELEYVTLRGRRFWGNIAANQITVAGRSLNLVRVTDISQRKAIAAQLAAQNLLLSRIARGEPLSEILEAVIAQVEQQLPGAMGSVLLLKKNCLWQGAALSLPAAYARALDGIQLGSGMGAFDTAASLKQTVICSDLAAEPRWANSREFSLAHDLRACWSMPILAADDQLLGTFSVYYSDVRSPQASELELLLQVVKIVGIAIERDQAEAKIRRSEEQLQLTLDFTGIGAWNWQPLTGEYAWNGQMTELLELPLGLSDMFVVWSERIHPDDLERVQASIQTALENQTAFAEEYRYRLHNGQVVWRWCKGQGLYTAAGELKRVLGIVQDITERKQAEATLALMEAQQRSILENIPGFVAKVDRAGEILFLNRTAPGFTMADVIGQKLEDFTDPESQQVQQEALEQVFSTGAVVTIETLGTGAHGSPAYYEVRLAPLYRDGQIEAAIMVTTDTTARKQVELALRQSEAKQRALISALPDLIMRINSDGVYLDFFAPNRPNIIGKTGDFVGTRVEESLPPELAEKRMQAIRAALQTGEIQVYEQEILVNGVPQIEECRVVVCAANEVLVLGRDISDRKQAELALRESESRFRQLAETVREGFFVADPASFSYLYVNPAYETITGFSAPEVYANPRHWLDSIHPEDQERVAAALQQELQGLPFDQEYRFIRPDGTTCWLRSQAFPILSETGELIRVVGTMEDITIRKQTEAALRESEERRRLALDLTSTGSWEFVVATGEAVWSDSQYRLMGLIPGEQASHFQTWRERVHPADLEWVEQQFTQALATRSLLETEYRVLYPDGTIRWVLTKGQGIYDATGEPIRMLGVMVDVTDRKLAEQALQQLNEELELRVEQRTQDLLASQLQLQAKEQFLRGVFEGTGNPIFVVDVQEDGAFQYTGWNRASEIISGVSSADVQGKSPQTLFPGAIGDALAANYRRCCEAGETIRYEEYLKFEQDDAWTLTTLTPLKDAAGRAHRIVGSAFDISERKRAELALQEAQRFTQSIADNTPNIIYIYDLNASRNIYANREVVELLGYAPEEIQSVGDHFLEVASHPNDLARFGQIQQQIRQLADGEILEIEYRMRHRDGTWHWLYDRISVFNRDDAGAVIQFIGAAQDITDRKRAEAALAEKNAILQSVMESTPDVVYVKDAQGRYVIVNSGFVEFFGQPADQLLGRTDAELVPAAIAAQLAENDRQTIQSGVSHTIEEAVPRPDGSLRVYLTTKSPWRIPQGNQIGIVGLSRDITERKLAEQALFESKQRYATLAAAVPVGIYRTSRSGDCLYVNERWCQIAGLTAAEALGTGWLKALHPDDCERIFQVWEQFVRTGSPFQLEYRFLRPDGIVTWVFGQAIQELDESGVIGYIGTITDITERKQAEAQLREQEQFLRSIYEGVQQPIFVGDVLPDQSIRMASWNPAAAKLTGISSEEVAGKAVMDIFLPDQAAEMLARYAQSITTGRPATFEERITFQNQTRWMLSTYNPLINSEGQVHRVVGTVYDITDRKQLEQELRQINLELEQRVAERTQDLQQAMEAAQMASRAKTTFLSNMSHELRTPLNAILGFGQLLSRDNLLNLDQQEQIEIINRSGEHLLALINDVLAMSKIEAGQTTLNISRFNLGDLLRDLDALFQLKAETKQLRLTVQTDPQIPHLIQTDESKLRQVLINLVGNAIKFTERGSVTVRVWPEADAHPSANPVSTVRLHFEVEDTGFGIALEEQELVFEPFVQTQSGRNSQEGTGLGLPISRQFVQLMGGDLRFISRLNQGTCFYFTIPVAAVELGESGPDGLAARITGLAADQPSYRLLIVDDQPDSRRFLIQLLGAVGFELREAANGQEALDLWQTWSPDLIWMDMRMPMMDGYTATQEIRRLEQAAGPARAATKILALTASAFEDDREPILAAGCDDILFKPVTEAALFEKLAQHLGVRYRHQEDATLPPACSTSTDPDCVFQDLGNMPSDWLARLRYAARTADEELILSLIDQLPPTAAPLADRLRELVESLQIERLIELTASHDEK